MNLLIEIIVAIAIFFGVMAILALSGVAGILGSTFVAIIKVLLVVAAIIWVVRLLGTLYNRTPKV